MAGPQTEELDRRHVEDSSSGRQTKTRGGAELDSSTTLNTSDEASAFPPAASIAVRIYLCIYLLITVVEKSLCLLHYVHTYVVTTTHNVGMICAYDNDERI